MLDILKKWLQNRYQTIVHSIAFFPAVIGFFFLIISYLFIEFDFSSFGEELKSNNESLQINDPDTARTIVSAIAGGIISLTVFSFSMVMIVLNQAASNLSNRVLDNLIGNRQQQIVLGIYIGTIVYALFLLTAIRGHEFGDRIPSISVYLGIVLTVIDIFIFIYFLHFITQSVKYDVIIRRIYRETKRSIQREKPEKNMKGEKFNELKFTVPANYSGVFEGCNQTKLAEYCKNENLQLELIHFKGTYLLSETELLKSSKQLTDKQVEELHQFIFLVNQESIEQNFTYGIRQLKEIAIKALSPGINDPGTAIESLKAIFQLFDIYLKAEQPDYYLDEDKNAVIKNKVLPFDVLFEDTIPSIVDYGKDDRSINKQLKRMMKLLKSKHDLKNVKINFH